MKNTHMSDYITVKEAIGTYPIGRTKLYSLFKKKRLKKYKLGGSTMVKISELSNLIQEAQCK